MDRLTQEQSDHYYSQTNPRKPLSVREIHAIRMAVSGHIEKHGWDKYLEKANQAARESQQKHNRPYKPVPTLG